MARGGKRWGQHWLASDELARELVSLVGPAPGQRFLEIGPGHGRLTTVLLEHSVDMVAVEVDAECVAALEALDAPGAPRFVQRDILDYDPGEAFDGQPVRVVGNLPYYISSPVLGWIVRHRQHVIDAHVMLAAEVAERVAAGPGSRRYGVLSLRVQWEFTVTVLRRLGPGEFRPPPRVDSVFLRLEPRPEPVRCDAPEEHRVGVIGAAFAHRRKTLANSLQKEGWTRPVIATACAEAGVDPGLRAEALAAEDFARLAEALSPA